MRIRHVDSAIAVTGKARFVRCLEWMNHTGALILGLGVATTRFWAGCRRRLAGGRWGCGRVVKHYYILSCTGTMFESGDF